MLAQLILALALLACVVLRYARPPAARAHAHARRQYQPVCRMYFNALLRRSRPDAHLAGATPANKCESQIKDVRRITPVSPKRAD